MNEETSHLVAWFHVQHAILIHFLGSIYTKHLQQLCDDASDTVLIENNRIAWKWVAATFRIDSIVFNENNIASVIAELLQHWLWCLV